MSTLDIVDTNSVVIRPTLEYSPDAEPTTVDLANDEFDSVNYPLEVALDTAGTRFAGATPWAWRNQGAATAAINRGNLVLTAPASASDNLRIVEQVAPVGLWRYRAKISGIVCIAQSEANFGLTIVNTSNSSMYVFVLINGPRFTGADAFYNNVTSYSGIASTSFGNPYFDVTNGSDNIQMPFWLELEKTATQILFRFSPSGVDGTFYLIDQITTSDHITTVNTLGFVVNTTNSAVAAMSVGWWRRFA